MGLECRYPRAGAHMYSCLIVVLMLKFRGTFAMGDLAWVAYLRGGPSPNCSFMRAEGRCDAPVFIIV